jgi:hypothetical protein
VIRNDSETGKSVARIRLVKTEDLSACTMVNWKVRRIAIVLLPVVPSYVNVKNAINPFIQSKIRRHSPTRDNNIGIIFKLKKKV